MITQLESILGLVLKPKRVLSDFFKVSAIASLIIVLFCSAGRVELSLAYFVDEIQTIGWIFDHVFYIHGHQVKFSGEVKSIDLEPAVPVRPCVLVKSYVAVIEDSTGSIQAVICGEPTISVGDHVVARALIMVVNPYEHPPILFAHRVFFEPSLPRPE